MEWLMFPCLFMGVDVHFWLLPLSLATAWDSKARRVNNSISVIPLTSFSKIAFLL
jgi:hypothetical protein